MRRVIMGIVWFFLLAFLFALGVGLPASLSAKHEPGRIAQQEGYDAASRVQRKYGALIWLAALGISVVGTYKGFLPGTKQRADQGE
jgi:hypothetical protein